MEQHVYKNGDKYYLVDIWDNGAVTLKLKDDGWGDIWSLPLEEVKP